MAGHVYLIGSHRFHWYKIGKSSDARIRISDLGILLPFKIEIVAVWKAENHHELEHLLHEKYSLHKINGEWFSFSVEQINNLLFQMQKAQITLPIAKFSNIQEDVVPRAIQSASFRELGQKKRMHPELRKRIDQLVKQRSEIEAEAQKRIDVLVQKITELTQENAELRHQVSVSTSAVGNR